MPAIKKGYISNIRLRQRKRYILLRVIKHVIIYWSVCSKRIILTNYYLLSSFFKFYLFSKKDAISRKCFATHKHVVLSCFMMLIRLLIPCFLSLNFVLIAFAEVQNFGIIWFYIFHDYLKDMRYEAKVIKISLTFSYKKMVLKL